MMWITCYSPLQVYLVKKLVIQFSDRFLEHVVSVNLIKENSKYLRSNIICSVKEHNYIPSPTICLKRLYLRKL